MRLQTVVSAVEEKLEVLGDQKEEAQPSPRGEGGQLWRNDISVETERMSRQKPGKELRKGYHRRRKESVQRP